MQFGIVAIHCRLAELDTITKRHRIVKAVFINTKWTLCRNLDLIVSEVT
jgi:hypothetical protein